MTTNHTQHDYTPPENFPVHGVWAAYRVDDPMQICLFRPGAEEGCFQQYPVTWTAGTLVQGVFHAHLMTNPALQCFFTHSETREGVFWQQFYYAPWNQMLCSCPGGIKGQHKHRCKHLKKDSILIQEHMPTYQAVVEKPAIEALDLTIVIGDVTIRIATKGQLA